MTLKPVCRMTPEARTAFHDILCDDLLTVSEKKAGVLELVNRPESVEEVAGTGSIDADRKFKTNLEYASHVWSAIEGIGIRAVADPGINAFLNAVYIEQLLKTRKGQLDHFILDRGSNQRNARNPTFLLLRLYATHRDSEIIHRQFLGGSMGTPGDVLQKIADNSKILGSRGALELIGRMFMAPRSGKLRPFPGDPKRSSRLKTSPKEALNSLFTLVFGQIARNYDVESMSADQILKLVPDVPILLPWKETAAEVKG